MHLRLVSILAAVLLVAACETTPEDSGGSAGTGASIDDDASSSSSSSVDSEMTEKKETVEEADLGPTQEGLIAFAGDRVFFDLNKYNVKAEGQRALERQAEWLARYPSVSFTIEGHCDERGTREYNLALGERRAQSSKSYLVALGVDPDRITTVSYGKERPEAVGSNDAAWSQNRRAVSIIN